jgi:hypothetical protein
MSSEIPSPTMLKPSCQRDPDAKAVLSLENAFSEEQAESELSGFFQNGELRKLHNSDIEYVIENHYWGLANKIIMESHKQGLDLLRVRVHRRTILRADKRLLAKN